MKTTLLKDYPDVLTVEQVQKILQIGRTQVYELVKKGKLAKMSLSKTVRIPKNSLIRWIEKTTEEAEKVL